MHAVVAVAIVLAAHVTGAINTVASVLGPVGTVISTIDKTATDAVNIKNFVVAKEAAHKRKVAKKTQ